MRALGGRADWVLVSYNRNIASWASVVTRALDAGVNVVEASNMPVELGEGYTPKLAVLQDALERHASKYERTWLLDSDVSLEKFDLDVFLGALACTAANAADPAGASIRLSSLPVVAQPVISGTGMSFPLNQKRTWEHTNVVAVATKFIETGAPLVDSDFLLWFMRHLWIREEPEGHLVRSDWGIDPIRCGAAEVFASAVRPAARALGAAAATPVGVTTSTENAAASAGVVPPPGDGASDGAVDGLDILSADAAAPPLVGGDEAGRGDKAAIAAQAGNSQDEGGGADAPSPKPSPARQGPVVPWQPPQCVLVASTWAHHTDKGSIAKSEEFVATGRRMYRQYKETYAGWHAGINFPHQGQYINAVYRNCPNTVRLVERMASGAGSDGATDSDSTWTPTPLPGSIVRAAPPPSESLYESRARLSAAADQQMPRDAIPVISKIYYINANEDDASASSDGSGSGAEATLRRRTEMESALSKLGIPYERFPAAYPRSMKHLFSEWRDVVTSFPGWHMDIFGFPQSLLPIAEYDIERLSHYHDAESSSQCGGRLYIPTQTLVDTFDQDKELGPVLARSAALGVLGNAVSHDLLRRKIVEEHDPTEFVLVLEDDATEFSPAFEAKFYRNAARLPMLRRNRGANLNWDVLRLYALQFKRYPVPDEHCVDTRFGVDADTPCVWYEPSFPLDLNSYWSTAAVLYSVGRIPAVMEHLHSLPLVPADWEMVGDARPGSGGRGGGGDGDGFTTFQAIGSDIIQVSSVLHKSSVIGTHGVDRAGPWTVDPDLCTWHFADVATPRFWSMVTMGVFMAFWRAALSIAIVGGVIASAIVVGAHFSNVKATGVGLLGFAQKHWRADNPQSAFGASGESGVGTNSPGHTARRRRASFLHYT